jgi:dipeptidase D
VGIRISDMSAGGRLNVIPNFARAVVCFEKEHGEKIDEIVSSLEKEIRADCVSSEPNICVTCKEVSNVNTCASSADTDKIIFALMQMIDGVYEMSPDIASLVRTSSNIGSVDTENERLVIGMMIRSNTAAGKSAVVRNIKSLAEYIGAELCLDDDYPAWEYRANSPLRAIMEKAYEDMYGNKPQICAIHAGLECGIISEKLKDADMVSIGPTMENVHTSSERLSVDSVKRVWEYLLHVLEMLK